MIAPLTLAAQAPSSSGQASGAAGRSLFSAFAAGLVGHRGPEHGAWLPTMSFRARHTDVAPDLLLRAIGARRGAVRPVDVAVLVHGLFVDEQCWTAAPDGLARRLEQHFGWTPLLVRYNAGRHISHNGDDLADLLVELHDAWGSRLGRVTLIGHSMGGLVARSALGALERRRAPVLDHVDRLFLLATPNHGANLERLGHVVELALRQLARLPARGARLLGVDEWLEALDAPLVGPALRDLGADLLGKADATASAPARSAQGLLALRSDGIRDVRFGYMQRIEWEMDDHLPDRLLISHRRPLPPPRHVDTFAIAGSVWPAPGPTPSSLRTDGLVSCASAAGTNGDFDDLLLVARGRYVEIPLLVHQLIPSATRVRNAIAQLLARPSGDLDAGAGARAR